MYRAISRSSSGLIRQATTRVTRQLSTTRTRPSNHTSRLLLGVVGTGALAFGYFSQQSSLIQNASTADNIEKAFQEGDAVAKEAQESLDLRQEKVVTENEEKTKKAKDTKSSESKTSVDDKKANSQSDGQPEGEGEGKQEAAFNPDTGEINWDCPCLGGMAHGPCGEEFKEAFSCFVFSETEPKGIDCIKKFENMRSCFKRYPEHYKDELYDDGEEEASTEVVEHVVLETTEPAIEQIEQGINEDKIKPNTKSD